MHYGSRILGTGAYVPEGRLTNQDLEQMVETTDEWIISRTGIRERRIAPPEEGSSHLATRAARAALGQAGLSPADLDLIIVATATPDMAFPPVAALVQGRLGAARAAAFDLNGVCAGFLYALVTGAQFIQSGAYRHVLVIGAETFSRLMDYTDRNSCILFGDGAGAVVLGRGEPGEGLVDFTLSADGNQAGQIYCPLPGSPSSTLEEIGADPKPYFWQNGRGVFKEAVTRMGGAVEELLRRNGCSPRQLRLLVPHQANQRILDALANRLELGEEQVANCIGPYGNTSAATIPMALDHWRQQHSLAPGDLAVFTAFGSGVLWGAALWRWA